MGNSANNVENNNESDDGNMQSSAENLENVQKKSNIDIEL